MDHNNDHKILLANYGDLRLIMDAAVAHGVTEFEGFGLKIKFRLPEQQNPAKTSQDNREPAAPSARIAEDEEVLEDLRAAQLMIDDPVSFEQEQIDAQIGDRRVRAQDSRVEQDLPGR